MKLVRLEIDGMKCSMCESHICDEIRKSLLSAKKVKASAAKGEASFVVSDDEDESAAVNRIESGGYKVLHIESKPYDKKKFLFF